MSTPRKESLEERQLQMRERQHGTNSRYSRGCRCRKCREAHKLDARRRRDGIPPKIKPQVHGTGYAYSKRKCECEVCMEWGRREYQRRKAERLLKHSSQPVANIPRFERICRYAEQFHIPLRDAARLVDQVGATR